MHRNRIHKVYSCNICKVAKKPCKCERVYNCSKNCELVDWKTHKSDCFQPVDLIGSSISNENRDKTSSYIGINRDVLPLQYYYKHQDTAEPMPSTSFQPTQMPLESTSQSFQQVETEQHEFQPQYSQPSTSTNIAGHSGMQENFFSNLVYANENTKERDESNTQSNSLRAATTYDNYLNSLPLDFREVTEPAPSHINFYGRDDQLFDENLLQVIENSIPFNYQFEDQKLLQETKQKLEQELFSLNKDCQNSQIEQSLEPNNSADSVKQSLQCTSNSSNLVNELGAMALQTSEKFVNHPKMDDQTLYQQLEEQFNLEEMCCSLIRDLNEYGVCVIDDFMGYAKGIQVLSEVQGMHNNGLFKDGQLVSVRHKQDIKRIRGDKIAWIGGKEPGVSNISHLINQVDSVVTLANRMRNNGQLGKYNIRERTKAMVACYDGNGSHYIKHVDNPNNDGRCITAIYYLNLNWDVSQCGGLLRIFPENFTKSVVDIEPVFDRIIFFWSDRRNPHEVQNAFRTRYAVTLWYFDENERKRARQKYQNDCANNFVNSNSKPS